MTLLALWRHEVRRTGWAAPVTLAVCAALVVLLAVSQAGAGNDVATARTLQAVLEMGMPLSAGVLPLLDGLDEVDHTRRDACVAAINAWRDEHGMLPAVVCSRTADYDRLAQRLRLASAVALRPLSRSAVTGYLRAAGRPMAGVRAVLAPGRPPVGAAHHAADLSVVVLAYARVPVTRIRADGDIGTRRHRLLTDYVTAMLTRPRSGLDQDRAEYGPDQTLRWLS